MLNGIPSISIDGHKRTSSGVHDDYHQSSGLSMRGSIKEWCIVIITFLKEHDMHYVYAITRIVEPEQIHVNSLCYL